MRAVESRRNVAARLFDVEFERLALVARGHADEDGGNHAARGSQAHGSTRLHDHGIPTI